MTGPTASERDTIRLVRNLLVGVGVFVVGGLVAVLAGRDGGGDGLAVAGPPAGEDVADYLEARGEALGDADGVERAVVSFTRYVDPGDARRLVDRPIDLWLVAAPGSEPEATGDVAAWADETAAAARVEAGELDALIPTAGDPEFERQYAHDRDRLTHLAESIEAGTPLVFAVVVRAPAEALRQLAAHDAVRLVDVLPEQAVGGPAGLRPEERSVTGQPPTRP